jgi:hypothetical protein
MANSITVSRLTLAMRAKANVTALDLVPLEKEFDFPALVLTYANGVLAGQVDLLHVKQYDIPANTNQDYDLAAGTVLGPDGAALTFARVKAIIVALLPSPATPLLTLGGGSNPFMGPWKGTTPTGELRNGPKGGLYLNACGDATGWPVTAGTGDILRVRNPDATLAGTYVLGLLGCSA